MRTRVLAAMAAVVVLLSACSGGDDGAAAADPQETATAPAAEVASVEQWASKIAPLRANVEDQQASWDEATCSSLAAAGGAVDCQAQMAAMGLQSQAVAITLGGLADPDGGNYLGEPPAEIADLVAETVDAANAAVAADEAVACPGDDCTGTSFQFERAWDDLRDALTAWEPYL